MCHFLPLSQSTATSDSEIDYLDVSESSRAVHGYPVVHLRSHYQRGRRAHRDDDDSSGFSSSDYGDIINNGIRVPVDSYGHGIQRRATIPKLGSRSQGVATQRVETSLHQINGDLSRILSLLHSRSTIPAHHSTMSRSPPDLSRQTEHQPLHAVPLLPGHWGQGEVAGHWGQGEVPGQNTYSSHGVPVNSG